MTQHTPRLVVRVAATQAEIMAAQALRYRIFVEELGGEGGELTDHAARLERDRFDDCCEHLLLLDAMKQDAIVGTTRIMTEEGAAKAGRFASEAEFDLSPLLSSGRRLLEVGRTCLHPDHRCGGAMHQLWQCLAAQVENRGIEILFGLASLPVTDPLAAGHVLSYLSHNYLAPNELRPRSLMAEPLNPLAPDRVDRLEAILAMPALVKTYLRLGGRVGEGAFMDPRFRCMDICMVLDATTLPMQGRARWAGTPN